MKGEGGDVMGGDSVLGGGDGVMGGDCVLGEVMV